MTWHAPQMLFPQPTLNTPALPVSPQSEADYSVWVGLYTTSLIGFQPKSILCSVDCVLPYPPGLPLLCSKGWCDFMRFIDCQVYHLPPQSYNHLEKMNLRVSRDRNSTWEESWFLRGSVQQIILNVNVITLPVCGRAPLWYNAASSGLHLSAHRLSTSLL